MPTKEAIKIRGARVHNLKNIDVERPPGHKIVGIAGVSGSGKSSLALGVLVRRGLPPLPGRPVHLHPPPHDPGRQGTAWRRCCTSRRRWRCTSGPACPGHPQHLRHRHRAAEQPPADVLPPGKSHRCPNGHYQPPYPGGGGRAAELVCPDLRRSRCAHPPPRSWHSTARGPAAPAAAPAPCAPWTWPTLGARSESLTIERGRGRPLEFPDVER